MIMGYVPWYVPLYDHVSDDLGLPDCPSNDHVHAYVHTCTNTHAYIMITYFYSHTQYMNTGLDHTP